MVNRTPIGDTLAAKPSPAKVYFELETYDRYHRDDWEERLGSLFSGAPQTAMRVTRADEADFIIEPQVWHSFLAGRTFRTAPGSHYRRHPEKTFAWDSGDSPNGRLPGLYCSLSHRLASPARHRGFCYPLRTNRLVRECALDEARLLFGFSGNVTSPLRARLFVELQGAARTGLGLLRRTESIFNRLYYKESDQDRARFIDDMRQCHFVLCPRGNGLSSIRLFETMEAARVPVIISDALMLPQCVNWSECSIQVPERDIARLPAILAARESDWERLARNARRQWERCFGEANLLPTLLDQVRDIVRTRAGTEKSERYFFPVRVLPDFLLVKAKAAARRIQALPRRAARQASSR